MALEDMLRKAIEDEEQAYLDYERMAYDAEKLGMHDMFSLLKGISDDEERHAELVRRMYKSMRGEVLERISEPLDFSGPYEFKVWDWASGEIHESTGRYSTPEIAVSEAKAMIESGDFKRDHTKPYERGYQIKVVDRESTEIPGYDEWYKPGWMLEQRPFPQTYGDWVHLGENIKGKAGIDDLKTTAEVNERLYHIWKEEEDPATAQVAKRWLTEKAGELGIS